MKKISLIFLLLLSFNTYSQDVIPFINFNQWFGVVDQNNQFHVIDMQEIKGFKGGDNLVAYIDIRGNLRIYDGKKRYDISNMMLQYEISDKMAAWKIGQTLGLFSNGTTSVINYFAGKYILKDDILVYEDTRYNSIVVHWNGKDYPLQTSTTDVKLSNSVKIGENIVAYADNGGQYRIFYKGQTYDVQAWNSDINIVSGTDVAAFNDPVTRTFAVFDKGEFIDVEDIHVKKFKAGRGFVVYEDINGNLMMYRNSQKRVLCSFPGKWDVVDDVVMYENNGFTYVDVAGVQTMAANYLVTDFKLKNATFVFKNALGGTSAVVDGKVIDITNISNVDFEIYGNSVIVKMLAQQHLVLKKGKVLSF